MDISSYVEGNKLKIEQEERKRLLAKKRRKLQMPYDIHSPILRFISLAHWRQTDLNWSLILT